MRFVAPLVVVLSAGCSTSPTRSNPYDPEGTGPKQPGHITGVVFVEGLETQSGVVLHVVDAAGATADSPIANAAGTFISAAIQPGEYLVEVVVPEPNEPALVTGVVVTPGATTNIGALRSPLAPPTGVVSGLVRLDQTTLSPAGVRVVLTQRRAGKSTTWQQMTDAAGAYSFESLPAGEFEVGADREGFTPDWAQTTVTSAAATRSTASVRDMVLYPASAVVRFSAGTGQGTVIGAPYTRTADVSLLLLAFGGVNEMRYSESPDLVEGGVDVLWRAHVAEVPLHLSAGEGAKAVYAQFRVVDGQGAERLRTAVYSTSIVLDQSPPVVSTVTLAPAALTRGGVRYLTSATSTAPVVVAAFDGFSGIAGVRMVADGSDLSLVPFTSVSSTGSAIVYSEVVPLAGADGTATVQVQLQDGAGNLSDIAVDSVVVDATAPAAGAVTLTGIDRNGASAALTRVSGVAVSLSGFSDATSGLAEMMVSERADFLGARWEPFAASFGWTLTGLDGAKALHVRVRDAAGNESVVRDGNIVLDTTPPQGASVILDAGALYTSDQSGHVSLALAATGASWTRISTDGAFDTEPWVAYATTGDATLSGDGVKTVWVVFGDDAGNETTVTGSIIRDVTAPTGGALVVNGDATYTNSVSVTLSLTATGADEMQIAVDGTCDTEPWVAFASTAVALLASGEGSKTVCARYRDAASNTTSSFTKSITLDTIAPTAPVIATAPTVTGATSATVALAVESSDTNGFVYQVIGGTYATWTAVAGGKAPSQWTFTLGGDGVYNLGVRAVDPAGNVSGSNYLSVTRDTTPPAPPQNVAFIDGRNRVMMTWDASPSSDVVSYQVAYGYGCSYAEYPTLDGSFANEGPSPINVGDARGFVLTGLTNDNDLCVVVRAIDHVGLASALPSAPGQGAARKRPNPLTPEVLAEYHPDSKGIVHASAVYGDLLLVAERCTWNTGNSVTANLPTPEETCTATDGSLRIVSIADPRHPVQLARCSSDVGEACGLTTPLKDVRDVVTDGMFAYVAAGADGVVVLDVSNPVAPAKAAECPHNGTCLPSTGYAWALDVQAGMIYVADGPDGLRTIDAHDPKSLTTKAIRRCGVGRVTACPATTLGSGSPEYDADGSLANFDIPLANFNITSTTLRCTARDVQVVGAYAYLLIGSKEMNWCNSHMVKVFRLVDDSTDSVANNAGATSAFYPTGQQAVIDLPMFRPQRLHVSGDVLFVGNLSKLEGYYTPTLIGGGTADNAHFLSMATTMLPTMAAVAGPVLLVGGTQNNAADALRLFDLRDLATDIAAAPTLAASLPALGRWGDAAFNKLSPNDITTQGSLVFLAQGAPGMPNALEILDLQTPFVPSEIALTPRVTFPTNHYDIALRAFDRYLVARQGSGASFLNVYDLANIAVPAVVTGITGSALGGTVPFDLSWPYIFVADTANQVKVYDLTLPASPVLVGAVTVPATPTAVTVHGRYLLVGAGTSGVYTYNVSNPSAPYIAKGAALGSTTAVAAGRAATFGAAYVRHIEARAGAMYVTEGYCSSGCDGNDGYEAVTLPSDIFVTTTYSLPVQSSYAVNSTCSDGPRRGHVWGPRLWGAVQCGGSVLVGSSTLDAAAQGGLVPLATRLALPSTTHWSFGGGGRFIYAPGTSETQVIDTAFTGTYPVTYEVPGSIAGPNDLADSVAVGPYALFAGRSNELRVFDLEY